ncbi:MAG: Hsp20/alpha crystallin family protein [Bacteroidetes bacterium]|nr:MAG: Hsp20/alpha crystallin family protein [Bacteroidota bacterium]
MLATMKNKVFFPNQIDNFFGDNFNHFLETETKTKKDEIPPVNIMEDENKFEIHLSVPGHKKEDIKIEVDKDVLTVSSEQEVQNADGDFTRNEFNVQAFKSRFSLPDSANAVQIKASNNLGILTIEIPKLIKKVQKPKQIKVS